jgi:hypothetical protein
MSSTQEEKFSSSVELIVAEYESLREEILKLTEIQSQIVVLALVSFGTILTFGTQYKNAQVILMYPVLVLFLAIGWATNAHGIDMLGSYIQNQIELKVGTENIGWEHFSRKDKISHSLIAFWGSRAIFPVSQIIALAASLSLLDFNALTITLLVIALLSTVLCILFFGRMAWSQAQGKRLVI